MSSRPTTAEAGLRVTQRDIARSLGISHATISLALRGTSRISPPLTRRIQEAAQAWADRLPAGKLRDQVYSKLAYEQAASDLAAAARLLTAMAPASPAHKEATRSVLHAWANPLPTGPFTAASRPFTLGLADADVIVNPPAQSTIPLHHRP